MLAAWAPFDKNRQSDRGIVIFAPRASNGNKDDCMLMGHILKVRPKDFSNTNTPDPMIDFTW